MRRGAVMVGVAVSAATATLIGSPTSRATPSREERVAQAEQTMWDRYGGIDPAGSVSVTEPQAIVDMIAHHNDAIDGSTALLAHRTVDDRVQALAERLVRVQREQVSTMEAWLAEWYPGTRVTSSWVPMFADPRSLANPGAFLSTMTEHHQHAIWMYAGWVAAGAVAHDELGLLAARIAKGQEGEIAYMLQLRSALGQPAS